MVLLKRILWAILAVFGIAIAVSYYRFELDRIAEINEAIAKSEAELARKPGKRPRFTKQKKAWNIWRANNTI